MTTTPSTVSWLAYDSDARGRMRELRWASAEGAVDELGFRSIQLAFADRFFPGTSTQWTRPKYLLLVPWIFIQLEKSRSTSDPWAHGRKLFNRLRDELVDNSADDTGVIGNSGDDVQRLPDQVYWSGLRRWGIRIVSVSNRRALQRSNEMSYRKDVFSPEEIAPLSFWHPRVRELMPESFPDGEAIELLEDQAAFLSELLGSDSIANDDWAEVRTDSLLPRALEYGGKELPNRFTDLVTSQCSAELRAAVDHADVFVRIGRGAQLLYASMVAQSRGEGDEVEKLQTEIDKWRSELSAFGLDQVKQWASDFDEFERVVKMINPKAKGFEFVKRWSRYVVDQQDEIFSCDDARNLIIRREEQLKGNRARLRGDGRPGRDEPASRPLEIDFRFDVVKRVVQEIRDQRPAVIEGASK